MATPRGTTDDRLISRTYRAAVRIGEDFITVEETITLPVTATDEDVAQAVDLGMRMYRAQREAVEAQISTIREAGGPAVITVRDPEAPASEKQRNYIGALQEDLTWSNDQLSAYATDQSVDLVTMTKGQASSFIDGLKKLAEERGHYATRPQATAAAAVPTRAPTADSQPVAERQLQALDKVAQQQGLDLDAETQRRYGVAAHSMTYEQAGALLREWQRPAQSRRANTSGDLPF